MKAKPTLVITKAVAALSRRTGRGGGGSLPGLIAEKLRPTLAGELAAKLPGGVILVTGTNGKTTTTKLIAGILEARGERLLTNRSGSNLRRGIFSSLIGAATRHGNLDATVGLFEVDEASLRLVAAELKPRHIVVLNLFRDQLDRYGELDTTARMIGQGIAATEAKLYLNADDPLVASLAKYAVRPELVSYFGIDGLPAAASAAETAADSERCPACGRRLTFARVFYGHVGHYSCPNGDFDRPHPLVTVTSVDRADQELTAFTVAVAGRRQAITLPLPGTYNLYNGIAALALSNGYGISVAEAGASIATAKAAFGRVERIAVNGKTLYLLLIKNPAGFAQVLQTFLVGQPEAHILMVINDRHADGRDVSWLWDVPLEALGPGLPAVTVAGIRADDMALRLKYAGIDAVKANDLDDGLDRLLTAVPEGGTGYVLPTYTAMLEIRKALAQRTEVAEVAV